MSTPGPHKTDSPSQSQQARRLFDLTFSAQSQEQVLNQIIALAHAPGASSVIFANAHVVVESATLPALKAALNTVTLIVPDGAPVAWMLKGLGASATQRYSGPDLMTDVFKSDPGARHFFMGSTSEVLEKIKRRFDGNSAGFYAPPFKALTAEGVAFDEAELKNQLKLVKDLQADYIWVGLGAPKQEFYVAQMAAKAERGVWLAVGAAFDFYAETKPRAPKLLQHLGLEWAFRLAAEPRRLAKRYLRTNPIFIKMALSELWRRQKR